MVGSGEKIFKVKVLRRLESAISRLVFANQVLYKRAMLLMSAGKQNPQKNCCTFLRIQSLL